MILSDCVDSRYCVELRLFDCVCSVPPTNLRMRSVRGQKVKGQGHREKPKFDRKVVYVV